MAELIRRVIRSEIKSINEKDFTVDVIMSDETIDRYREVIKASAWKKRMGNYKAHPILLSSHNYHGLTNQIGEAVTIGVKENKLAAKFKYYVDESVRNPEADWAWVLASKGVAAYSVGFIRHAGRYVDPDEDYTDDEEMKGYQKAGVRYVYDDVELLECSHVTVPANPSCLQNSFDQGIVMRDLEEKAFPMMAELELALKNLSQQKELTDDQKREVEVENKKWEETENEIRHRIREPELFEKFRYITLKATKPRVKAVLGKLKNEDNEWKLQSLRFPKSDGWDIAKAKSWVKDHPDVVKELTEEDYTMEIEDFEKMVDELKVKLEESISTQLEAFKASSEEIMKKLVATFEEKIAELKAQKVEEVIGEEKIEEVEEMDKDKVLGIFDDITKELKTAFKIQS